MAVLTWSVLGGLSAGITGATVFAEDYVCLAILTDVTQHITVRCTSTRHLSIFTTNILVRCNCFA